MMRFTSGCGRFLPVKNNAQGWVFRLGCGRFWALAAFFCVWFFVGF